MDLLFKAKAGIARAIGVASRASGRGGGTTLPGRVLLRLDGEALAKLGRELDGKVTLVSASNGKTTTSSMIANALRAAGHTPVHNHAGSNMAWGVATAMIESRGDCGLFEVDEAWLPKVAAAVRPSTVCLGNLFRDQLDRYGELDRIVDEWSAMVDRLDPGCSLVLNADDPLVASVAGERPARDIVFFGIDDTSHAVEGEVHASDADLCRRCGGTLEYSVRLMGHIGHYRCPGCGWERPQPQVRATRVEMRGMDGTVATVQTPEGEIRLEVPLPGLYNVYNALAALAVAIANRIDPQTAAGGIGSTGAVFGRVEVIAIDDRELAILLIKNPVGANEVIRTLVDGEADKVTIPHLWIALNDRIADGRDISWVWDADFERLAGKVGRVTCAGTRAAEMALRLKYAGIDEDRLHVVGPVDESLDAALAATGEGERLFALPTYTALLELRTLLAKRGLAKDYWE